MISTEIMAHIMTLLLTFYLHKTPHPNPHFVTALRYLANQQQCSPMGKQYADVDKEVTDILYGKPAPCYEHRR